jgi:hypothetical protein
LREVVVSGKDRDYEHKHSQQIGLSGIMTVAADFPAHCSFPPARGHQINAIARDGVPRGWIARRA